MTDTCLAVSGLSISLDGKAVLKNVAFNVNRGEWISITGRNGAGKSTLLKCLMRILKMETGDVVLNGNPIALISQRSLARQVAYVPQATGRFSPFTVFEHVMLARYPHLRPFAAPSRRDRDIVMHNLAEAGLSELADRTVSTLSGGERQKVYLAQAFAQGADVLLLDEPNTFLDPKCAAEVLHLLKVANQDRGTTILSVTHDINSAAVISDRIMALKSGEVVFMGAPFEFMAPPVLSDVFSASFSFVSHPETGMPLVLPWRAS
ncbi:MAG: ABC transporter ATP-binding protein [Deltaproteobacteria bacterium]|nr:ABC transporter ATP-binding protein [Deltaproteobacteria bacterium]